ncbi:nitrate- and nitrite sensing domain-containing protein [Streptomyces sp. LX-29]|uniref:nitrate- and nitrite sensing domain-containing protein n=1 Tax=Streptomyces sp. LX-29 TaxID=2900152 RepID=UPI00240E623F|nr:nitrate- and nitrite sensing domain-containing protein [Streptomyces sp. LX-29]WFB07441.1 nitrate- and nitrite sensing domain-containing protein [Streptomyces sp. LX-29]
MRNRLVISVAVVAVAVAAAGAPAVLAAVDDTHDSQRLVELAESNRAAVALAHALADERDAMTEFVAAGRSTASGAGVSESQRARVDRQVAEVRPDAPAALRGLLDDLPETRQQALTGRGSALQVFEDYTETVQALHALADSLARRMPERADDGGARALAALGRADEEASATRGLLLAALTGDGGQPTLTAAAQRTNLREQAALADFKQLAPTAARERFDSAVNGTEVASAERLLARLLDQPRLSGTDLLLGEDRVESALSGRIDRMRGVEAALVTAEVARLEGLRDDDVTALEIRVGLAGLSLLLALGAGISGARSMTRPLAALRLGARRVAADPTTEEPIAFKGRDDEYADTVHSVNALLKAVRAEHERAATLEADRTRLVAERRRLAEERTELRQELDEVSARLEGLRARVHGSFVSLALRNLGLIERQLAIIEGLEEKEQDPDRLETLFQLDHLATGMRRYSENLLVIAGSEHKATHAGPVPLLDVLRASISEVERYDRVQIQSLPPHSYVAGFAADSVSHLVAELLENATAFSPPDAHVQVSGWLLETGELMLSVQDEGIGMTPERFDELNARLAEPVPDYCQGPDAEDPLGLGLYVVTRLAAKHGVRVQLREQKQGGVAAVVVLPVKILAAPPAGAVPADPAAAPAVADPTDGPGSGPSFPGSVAEANSNELPGRHRAVDGAGLPYRGEHPAEEHPESAAAAAEPEFMPDIAAEPEFVPDIEVDVEPGADPLVVAAERTIQLAAVRGDLAAPRQPEESPSGPPGADPTPVAGVPAAPDGAEHTPVAGVPAPGAERTPSGGTPVAGQPWAAAPSPAEDAAAAPAATPALVAPDEHARPAAEERTAPARPEPGRAESREAAPVRERPVTAKGLPKRTPKAVTRPAPTTRERVRSGVDAEELRRRLGGFQRGARQGRRDAEAEIAERTDDPARRDL